MADDPFDPWLDPSLATSKRHPLWNKAFLIIELACIPLAFWWFPYSHLPPPGWAVAFVACAAAAMSVHDDMKGWQKGLWLLVIGAFLITELRAINKDRVDNMAAQKAFFEAQKQGFSQIATQASGNFAATTDGLTTAINEANRILGTTRGVADLARENLESVNGTGSYPCIHPQTVELVDGKIPLIIWNTGKNNLTGVAVSILPGVFKNADVDDMYKAAIELGTIRPEWPKPVPQLISPELDAKGEAFYWVNIWTQNGFYIEGINFRKSKKVAGQWAYAYHMEKQANQQHLRPGTTVFAEPIKECQIGWTDEPQPKRQ